MNCCPTIPVAPRTPTSNLAITVSSFVKVYWFFVSLVIQKKSRRSGVGGNKARGPIVRLTFEHNSPDVGCPLSRAGLLGVEHVQLHRPMSIALSVDSADPV